MLENNSFSILIDRNTNVLIKSSVSIKGLVLELTSGWKIESFDD